MHVLHVQIPDLKVLLVKMAQEGAEFYCIVLHVDNLHILLVGKFHMWSIMLGSCMCVHAVV